MILKRREVTKYNDYFIKTRQVIVGFFVFNSKDNYSSQ